MRWLAFFLALLAPPWAHARDIAEIRALWSGGLSESAVLEVLEDEMVTLARVREPAQKQAVALAVLPGLHHPSAAIRARVRKDLDRLVVGLTERTAGEFYRELARYRSGGTGSLPALDLSYRLTTDSEALTAEVLANPRADAAMKELARVRRILDDEDRPLPSERRILAESLAGPSLSTAVRLKALERLFVRSGLEAHVAWELARAAARPENAPVQKQILALLSRVEGQELMGISPAERTAVENGLYQIAAQTDHPAREFAARALNILVPEGAGPRTDRYADLWVQDDVSLPRLAARLESDRAFLSAEALRDGVISLLRHPDAQVARFAAHWLEADLKLDSSAPGALTPGQAARIPRTSGGVGFPFLAFRVAPSLEEKAKIAVWASGQPGLSDEAEIARALKVEPLPEGQTLPEAWKGFRELLWLQARQNPNSLDSLEALARLEARFPEGPAAAGEIRRRWEEKLQSGVEAQGSAEHRLRASIGSTGECDTSKLARGYADAK